MSKPPRILYDLWISLVGGYAGIPQDSRLIFDLLSETDSVQVDGLLYSKKKFLFKKNSSRDFLFDAMDDLTKKENTLLNKLKIYFSVEMSNTFLRKQYQLYPIDSCYEGMLWRSLFSKTLLPENKKHILGNLFYYADISWRDMMFASYFNRKVHLDTRQYDFIIFPDVRPVTVSSNTKKIIRYHDSFAFLCPDFFQTYHSMVHLNSLKACKNDSYFVCNSEPTRQTLLQIYPELEKKTFVVPPTVRYYSPAKSWQAVKQICLTRSSDHIVEQKNVSEMYDKPFEYIFALSTLEPRKNYINLIRAWENIRYQYHTNIKLIIVANSGWLSGEIEGVMRPHVEKGNIIHLHHVSSDEMPYLFSHATLFASLSFIEGFGIPPLEAMQCACAVLASDNPAHRWSMGDAAYYVNPYDVKSITEGMANLLCFDGAMEKREEIIQKGLKRIQYYSADRVKSQWLTVLGLVKDK